MGAILTFFAGSLHFNSDYMRWQWTLGLASLLIPIVMYLQKKLSYLCALTFSFFIINAIYFGTHRQIDRAIAIPALFQVVIVFMFLLAFLEGGDFLKWCRLVLPYYGPINAFYMIVFGPHRLPQGVGWSNFLDYAGMGGVLLAFSLSGLLELCHAPGAVCWRFKRKWRPEWFFFKCLNPFFEFCIPYLRFFRIGLFILTVVGIGFCKSSIPYGVAAFGVAGFYVHRFRKLLPALGIGTIALGLGWLIEKGDFLKDGFRFPAYKLFMGYWWHHMNWVTGVGPGSFQTQGPLIQIEKNFMVDMTGKNFSFFWLWLHSDWMQIAFELGLVGIILFALIYLQCTWKVYSRFRPKDSALFGLLCAIGAAGIFDYPMRYFITALIIAYAVVASYHDNLPCEKSSNPVP